MANAESIVKYKQKYRDSLLAGIAATILDAYAREMSPAEQRIPNGVYHTPDGYAFITHDKTAGYKLYTSDKRIADFIEHVFSTYTGAEIKATEVAQSMEVLNALEKKFGMKAELNLVKSPEGRPAVWTTYKGTDKNIVKTKGFEYYDKGRWVIWL